MIRLRKLTMSGFRGARFPICLDFTGQHRSMAIFGENAGGKSTITDAVEWFLCDRVDHLWREDCKAESLRNVMIAPTDDTIISVEFNEKRLSASKTLTPAYASKTTNKSVELKEYLDQATAERHLLRHDDLTGFITKTKMDKRNEIAGIIGYDAVLDFRNVIQSALSALQKDTPYTTAKELVERRQAGLLELAGVTVATKAEMYEKANEIVKPYGQRATIINDESFDAALEQLKGMIGDGQKAAKQHRLHLLKAASEQLASAITAARGSAGTFLTAYKRLVENKEKIKQLNLEDFLRKGRQIIEGTPAVECRCPFCRAPNNVEHLKAEVEARLQELEANRREYEATRQTKRQYMEHINDVVRCCRSLMEKAAGLDVAETLVAAVQGYGQVSENLARAVTKRFEGYEHIEINEQRDEDERTLLESLRLQVKKTDDNAHALDMSAQDLALLEIIKKLDQLRELFGEFERNQSVKHAYERQITTLDAIFQAFLAAQNNALQDALDLMSTNISRYYALLHPGESVDGVRLRILGEEGVEFEYPFHGKKTYPPMKYLNESHLNSLGIALFLASVKLFNTRSQYFVLDDVISSFDIAHRRRLIRLLKDEFREWQVIVLTHESFWFDLLKRELASDGWLFQDVECDAENGVRLMESARDLRELIDWKRGQRFDVTNDIRRLMEKELKELCHALEVKVAFRYNDMNEKRMNGELLAALQGTINGKCVSLKNHPIFSKLNGSNAVGTTGSHDNSEPISDADIAVALQDIDELGGLFRCPCGTMVAAERPVPGEKKITCRCGEKSVDWKE